MDENRTWLTQKTEKSKCIKGNFTFPLHTQSMQLTCKIIEKVASQSYPLFQAKYLVTPQVTQFLEGPTSTLITGGGGGVPPI